MLPESIAVSLGAPGDAGPQMIWTCSHLHFETFQ